MSAPPETKAARTTVQTSARDPIERWLDVFTGLLAVSARERERIRDELEDHLRMRVEDLLILGHNEPEAVQQAVKELGETAELARRFKEATHQPRRSRIMHSILLAVAGTGLAVGALSITNAPVSAPTAPAVPAEALALLEAGSDDDRLTQDLPVGTLGDAFSYIAAQQGHNLFVHWNSIENVGPDVESELPAIPSSGQTLNRVLSLINSSLNLMEFEQIEMRERDGLIEFATREFFDASETITLDHDIAAIAPAAGVLEVTPEAVNLQQSIVSIIEPSVWIQNGGVASIAITGTQLSVRAPKRIQAQVDQYIHRLAQTAKERRGEQEHAMRAALEEENAHRLRAVEQLAHHRRELESKLHELKDRVEANNRHFWELEYTATDMERRYEVAESPQEREELRAQLVAAKARHASAEFDRDILLDEFMAMKHQLREADKELAAMSF